MLVMNILSVFIALICGGFFWMLFDANFEGKKTTRIILGMIIWLVSQWMMWFYLFR